MNERYRHQASGVVAMVTGLEVSTDGSSVRLELLSDPKKASDTDAVPFQIEVTRDLQPCCILQGSTGIYNDGKCPVHGEPFYLEHVSARPLQVPEAQLAAEWEPVTSDGLG